MIAANKTKSRVKYPPKKSWKRSCLCQNQGEVGETSKNVEIKRSAGRTLSKTNFIHENIYQAINSVAEKCESVRVDSRRGDKQTLNNSGLQPQYTKNKDYGQLPRYLLQRKQQHKIEQENYKRYVVDRQQQTMSRVIDKQEKLQILQGLKDNWRVLNAHYLSMSLTVDNHKKQMKKQLLETQLKQLENDIRLFENAQLFVIDKNVTLGWDMIHK